MHTTLVTILRLVSTRWERGEMIDSGIRPKSIVEIKDNEASSVANRDTATRDGDNYERWRATSDNVSVRNRGRVSSDLENRFRIREKDECMKL